MVCDISLIFIFSNIYAFLPQKVITEETDVDVLLFQTVK